MLPFARLFTPEDYPTIEKWWKDHDWPAVPIAVLPKLCLVVEDHDNDRRPIAFGALYMDNSVGVSMLEWVVTNPENTPRQSLASVKFLVGAIRELAADNGYGVTLTSAKQEALIRLYKREGFEETDSGMTHLLAFNPLKKT